MIIVKLILQTYIDNMIADFLGFSFVETIIFIMITHSRLNINFNDVKGWIYMLVFGIISIFIIRIILFILMLIAMFLAGPISTMREACYASSLCLYSWAIGPPETLSERIHFLIVYIMKMYTW